jgi:hypothetical protein
MALNSGLTIKEECISTDHHKQPVFDREEIIPGYNAKIWTVLFKYVCACQQLQIDKKNDRTVLRVNLPTNCTFQLFTPNLLWGCTKLKLVDNDSQKVVSDYPLEIRSCSLIANNNGYTLMAESKPPVTTLTGKIKLRIFGVINPLPVVGAEFSSKSIPQDIDGNYVLNKQRTLFRYF